MTYEPPQHRLPDPTQEPAAPQQVSRSSWHDLAQQQPAQQKPVQQQPVQQQAGPQQAGPPPQGAQPYSPQYQLGALQLSPQQPGAQQLPAAAPGGFQPTAPPTDQRGWWNRNLLGLLTILPVIALLIATRGESIYRAVWEAQPRIDITVAQEQWAQTPKAKMRLVEFSAADDLVSTSGQQVKLPDGVQAWRAVLEFEVANLDDAAGCTLKLEDSQGRLFTVAPDELPMIRGAVLTFGQCLPAGEQESRKYSVVALFVTPAGAKPSTLQIHWALLYPRYVRLAIAG